MDAAKPSPSASKEVTVDREAPPPTDPAAEKLGKMIADSLADFDPESPSERRLKVNAPRPAVSFPRDWAKKAG